MLAAVPKPKRLKDAVLIERARIGARYVGGGQSVRFITASSSGVDGVVLPLRHEQLQRPIWGSSFFYFFKHLVWDFC